MHTIACKATTILLVIFLCCDDTEAHSLFMGTRNTAKYCGKQLRDTLQQICNGVYNPMYKRTNDDSDNDNDDYYTDRENLGSYLRSRQSAFQFLPSSFQRFRRGVADECCKKTCTLREMQSYCGK